MDYGEITHMICDKVEDSIVDGRLDFPRYTFANAVVSFFAGVRLNQDSDGFWYSMSPDFAVFLASLARKHYHFFDLCVDICATNIGSSRPLPETLAFFAASVLRGDLQRPTPRHRERSANWLELNFIHSLVMEAVEAGLHLTRNDASPKNSACHAVAEALTVCGRQTSFSEIKRLMVHGDYEQLRHEFRATQKIFQSSHDRRISNNALDLEAYGARKEMEQLVMLDILDAFTPSRGESP